MDLWKEGSEHRAHGITSDHFILRSRARARIIVYYREGGAFLSEGASEWRIQHTDGPWRALYYARYLHNRIVEFSWCLFMLIL